MQRPAIDLDYERHALEQEAALVAAMTMAGVPSDEVDAYLHDIGYGRRLAAYKAALDAL